MKGLRIVTAMCGSFCTFSQVMSCLEQLAKKEAELIPVMSKNAFSMDTKFGEAEGWNQKLCKLTNQKIITTIQEVEPFGPKGMADIMLIAPCTGNTLAKLAAGITDGPVTMAAKSMLRAKKPIVIAMSTNDGLAATAKNIGELLNRKHYYFVPFGQDDWKNKPCSLQADFSKVEETLKQALQGEQLQPVLIQK